MEGKRQKRSSLEFLEDKLVRPFSRRVKPGSESSPMYIMLLDPFLTVRMHTADRSGRQESSTATFHSIIQVRPAGTGVRNCLPKDIQGKGNLW